MKELRKNCGVLKFVAHSKKVLRVAYRYGSFRAARSNLRDVREFDQLGLLDIDWRNYNFKRHLLAVKSTRPLLTVARDIEDIRELSRIIDQASELSQYCRNVIVVPKARSLATLIDEVIPPQFILGYSVPTRYGATLISPKRFRRPVHLLGGRPDVQRRMGALMPVVSVDCNRFTLDARFGDYFDGETFRPHPAGGYSRCVREYSRTSTFSGLIIKGVTCDNSITRYSESTQ